MKIIHIITSLLDGGAEGVLFRLCCKDKINQHLVVSLRDKGKYGKLLSKSGIKVYTLNMMPGRFSFLALYKLIRIIKSEKVNLVQTWLYHADFFGGIAARLAGIKNLIWNIRHSNFDKNYPNKNLLILVKLLAKLSFFLPKKMIFCSKNSIKIHKKIGYQSKKIDYVPNGYDLHKFRIFNLKQINLTKKFKRKKEIPLLGCVARFHPQKDHENLLRALKIVKQKKIPFECILVGHKINKKNKKLINMIKKFNLKDEVILLGPQKNIDKVMNLIDIHISASEYGEAFPNVVAEAMASGTPCVVTNVGDSSLIVGKTGWIVRPSNSKELAINIEKAIKKSRSKNWKYFCLTARNRIVNKFSLKKMINNYNKIWHQTLLN